MPYICNTDCKNTGQGCVAVCCSVLQCTLQWPSTSLQGTRLRVFSCVVCICTHKCTNTHLLSSTRAQINNLIDLICAELDSDGPRHENRTWSHDWFTSVKSWLFAKGHVKERNRIEQPKPNPVTVTVTPGNKKSYVPLLKKDENKKYLEFRT